MPEKEQVALRALHPVTAFPLDIVRSYAIENMNNYNIILRGEVTIVEFFTLTASDDNISGIGAVSTVITCTGRALETASYALMGTATTMQSWVICCKPSCWNTTKIKQWVNGHEDKSFNVHQGLISPWLHYRQSRNV